MPKEKFIDGWRVDLPDLSEMSVQELRARAEAAEESADHLAWDYDTDPGGGLYEHWRSEAHRARTEISRRAKAAEARRAAAAEAAKPKPPPVPSLEDLTALETLALETQVLAEDVANSVKDQIDPNWPDSPRSRLAQRKIEEAQAVATEALNTFTQARQIALDDAHLIEGMRLNVEQERELALAVAQRDLNTARQATQRLPLNTTAQQRESFLTAELQAEKALEAAKAAVGAPVADAELRRRADEFKLSALQQQAQAEADRFEELRLLAEETGNVAAYERALQEAGITR